MSMQTGFVTFKTWSNEAPSLLFMMSKPVFSYRKLCSLCSFLMVLSNVKHWERN